MGISQERFDCTSLHEMGISLNLKEAEVFCEALYKLGKRNSETKERVEIQFSGDNNAKTYGAPGACIIRSGTARCVPLTITIEPVNATKWVAKLALQTPAEDKFFCSAVLSAQNALILSYMVHCGYVGSFLYKRKVEEFRRRART